MKKSPIKIGNIKPGHYISIDGCNEWFRVLSRCPGSWTGKTMVEISYYGKYCKLTRNYYEEEITGHRKSKPRF